MTTEEEGREQLFKMQSNLSKQPVNKSSSEALETHKDTFQQTVHLWDEQGCWEIKGTFSSY